MSERGAWRGEKQWQLGIIRKLNLACCDAYALVRRSRQLTRRSGEAVLEKMPQGKSAISSVFSYCLLEALFFSFFFFSESAAAAEDCGTVGKAAVWATMVPADARGRTIAKRIRPREMASNQSGPVHCVGACTSLRSRSPPSVTACHSGDSAWLGGGNTPVYLCQTRSGAVIGRWQSMGRLQPVTVPLASERS